MTRNSHPKRSSRFQVLPARGHGRRVRRRLPRLPDFTIEQILQWADEWHEHTGQWPRRKSGRIPGALGVTWTALDVALKHGNRGLPGGSSLAQLLWEKRGVWHRHGRFHPPLTIPLILKWADGHYRRSGSWPTFKSGAVLDAPVENWQKIDFALRRGMRTLPGGSSLAHVLAEHRPIRNVYTIPELSEAQILQWADEHHQRTGEWPTRHSGAILEAPEETWAAVDASLHQGYRGLTGPTSLAQLLAARRGVRNVQALPKLRIKEIVAWADSYKQRQGRRPTYLSGSIPEAPGETWGGVHIALYRGGRGFPGGSSLFRVLQKYRGETHYPQGTAKTKANRIKE